MTRINLIDPELLCDQHLMAEIKEINQLSGSFRKSAGSSKGIDQSKISKFFTLNTGHVYFFYNKGLYLERRFAILKKEAIRRGYSIKAEFNNEWVGYNHLYNDWTPSLHDIRIITQRLIEKIRMKPDWYTLNGLHINADAYCSMLEALTMRK